MELLQRHRFRCSEPRGAWSDSDTHRFHRRPDHLLLGSSEALGWRNLFVLDQIEQPFDAVRPPVKDHLLVYVQKNSAYLTCKLGDLRGSKVVHPETISIVPANAGVSVQTASELHSVHVYLKSSLVDAVLEETGQKSQVLPQVAISDPVLCGLIQGCAMALRCGQLYSDNYVDHLAWAMAAHLAQAYTNTARPLSTTRSDLPLTVMVKRVEDYVRGHLSHAIGLSDLARVADYSPVYFGRVFKEATGQSPYQFVLHARVKAVQVSMIGRSSLAEIAAATGFCNQEHMTRVFRKVCGLTPAQFRKLNLSKY